MVVTNDVTNRYQKKQGNIIIQYVGLEDLADIDEREEKIYRQLAKDFLSMNESTIKKMVDKCTLFEVR